MIHANGANPTTRYAIEAKIRGCTPISFIELIIKGTKNIAISHRPSITPIAVERIVLGKDSV